MAVSAGSPVFLVFLVVLSSTLALPIDTDYNRRSELEDYNRRSELEDYNRRSDLESSYGEMRKAVEEKRLDSFADKSENDDYERYRDENLDYSLLERLTNEMLEENGGNLDRELTDLEYEEMSERYFKRLEQERGTENANAWKTPPPTTEYGSKIVGTTWATPTATATDHGKTIVYTTPYRDHVSTTATQRDQWWTTHGYWWTSPTYWDGTLWGLKTAWKTWKQTTAGGTDSGKVGDHTKHFDWTGESNSGHRVHVVVYFEK